MPTATSATSTADRCEIQIEKLMADADMHRAQAINMLKHVKAELIADDVAAHRTPWLPWVEEYCWLRDFAAATIAPGLAEHTAAAQEKIIEASR